MENLKQRLIELEACNKAIVWSKGKTIQQVWETCHRGDWMLWLYSRTNPGDLRLLILAKGHCANTVRHLMNDQRSLDAVDAAIDFGNNKISIEELNSFNAAAYAAYAVYVASAAATYAYAAAAAVYTYAAADADAYAADADAAAVYASHAASAAYAAEVASYVANTAASFNTTKKANQLLTSDICRKYLPCPTI